MSQDNSLHVYNDNFTLIVPVGFIKTSILNAYFGSASISLMPLADGLDRILWIIHDHVSFNIVAKCQRILQMVAWQYYMI